MTKIINNNLMILKIKMIKILVFKDLTKESLESLLMVKQEEVVKENGKEDV
jgi:hypothetical protein